MIIKDWKKDLFTIPNMLSLFRLMLVPVYAVIYLNAVFNGRGNWDYYLAAGILAVSCLTDLIDGQIARRFNMISTIGKILDPLADKVTQFTMVVCLSFKHPILWILIVLIFVKEIFQLTAAAVRFTGGKMLPGARLTGKMYTTVLFVSLILMVMLPDIPPLAVNIITFVDLGFLMAAFIDYIIVFLKRDSMFYPIDQQPDQKNQGA